jgi:hypothetical protein
MFDAQHRKRTTPQEAAHKKKWNDALAAKKLKERRREQQDAMDKERDAANRRACETIRADVRAHDARKSRTAKALAAYERSERGPLTADDLALLEDFRETL